MNWAFLNATLVDPEAEAPVVGGLIVENGVITHAGPEVDASLAPASAETIACEEHLLMPGLVDMLASTGEPGNAHLESFASASSAAAHSGVTTLILTPDTSPPIDDPSLVEFMVRHAQARSTVRMLPTATITKALQGETLSDMALLKDAGAVAFSDGARSVVNGEHMRQALLYAGSLAMPILHHAEDQTLANNGMMHEGALATRLGLPAHRWMAETVMVERDIRLCEGTGMTCHITAVSSRHSVEAIRAAQARGVGITCGVAASHLMLDESAVAGWRTFAKLSPPLRSTADRLALLEGLRDGTISTVVSAHRPRDPETKRLPFAEASFGAAGIETLLPILLAQAETVPLTRLVAACSLNPARLLNLPYGRLRPDTPADLTLVNPHSPWTLNPENLRGRARNTPFDGISFPGQARLTLVNGHRVA